jgi:hypothetical protein
MAKKFEIKFDQVPISQKTLDGAHLNIDDIQILCRTLSVWSDPLEDEFDKINKSIAELTKTVDCTKLEVQKLKRLNSWWFILFRWTSGVVTAVVIAWYLFTNYWHK